MPCNQTQVEELKQVQDRSIPMPKEGNKRADSYCSKSRGNERTRKAGILGKFRTVTHTGPGGRSSVCAEQLDLHKRSVLVEYGISGDFTSLNEQTTK